MIKIGWLKFGILLSFYLLLLNYNAIFYIFERSNLALTASFAILYIIFTMMVFILFSLPFVGKFVASCLIIISTLASYFLYNYNVLIDEATIRTIFATNLIEASGFVSVKLILYILFLAILPVAFVIFAKIDYKNGSNFLKFRAFTLVSLLIFALAIFLPQQMQIKKFIKDYRSVKLYNLPYNAIRYAFRVAYANLTKPAKVEIGSGALIKTKDKKLMIFILGESARRANFSILGYGGNDTNFYTKQEANLVYFSRVKSCGTLTSYSLPCMFSDLTQADFNIAFNRQNLFDLLQKVGVEVVWLSNNGTYGRCEGVCDTINFDKKFFAEEKFDEVLLDVLKDDLSGVSNHKNLISQKPIDLIDHKLVVLHLVGSHAFYHKRYPDRFRKFTPTCDKNDLKICDQQSLINEYDNTLLYTDFLITQIINLTKSIDRQVVVFYISDHGESLGENGAFIHGHPYDSAPKEQVEIPMMIYANDDELLRKLRARADENLSHDNVFSSVLGFFEIEAREYEKELDLFR